MPLPEMQDIRQGVSEFRIQHFPAAGHFLQDIIHHNNDRIRLETSTDEQQELCQKLYDLTGNPLWREAKTFASVYTRGADVVVGYLEVMGIMCGKDRTLQLEQLEKKWSTRQLPVEFMDLPNWLTGKTEDTRLQMLARKAARDSWNGYSNVKRDLTPPGNPEKSVSLLIRPTVDKTLEACELSGCKTVLVIGISEDEVKAFADKGITVVGLNLGTSPKLEEMVKTGEVAEIRLGSSQKRIDETTLVKGKCHVIRGDVLDGIPFPDGSVVVMGNYFMHHTPFDTHTNIIRESARVAAPIGEDGIRKAFIFGEDSPSFDLTLLKISLNPAITAFDAVVSQVRGVLTVERLKKKKDELAGSGIFLSFSETPDFPLPYKRLGLQRSIMPVSQILITGF